HGGRAAPLDSGDYDTGLQGTYLTKPELRLPEQRRAQEETAAPGTTGHGGQTSVETGQRVVGQVPEQRQAGRPEAGRPEAGRPEAESPRLEILQDFLQFLGACSRSHRRDAQPLHDHEVAVHDLRLV